MKILILVLSYNDGVYAELMKSQQQTWDSIEVEGVRTVYYYGGGKGWVNEKEFSANSKDEYYLMHDKLLDCLKEVIDWDWDFVWRTNSSSYINKQRLVEFCNGMPKEMCYAGWELQGQGWNSVSGAGILMSKDVVKTFMEVADRNFLREEDIYIGQVLNEVEMPIIDDKSRYDVTSQFSEIPLDRFHYRFKTGDRYRDVENMIALHKLISMYECHKPIGEHIQL